MPAIIRIKKEDPSGITTPPSGNATLLVGYDVVSGIDYNNHITLKLDDGTLKSAGQWIIEDDITNSAGLPFAGNVDFNGNVTIGNSSSDSLAVSATSRFAEYATFGKGIYIQNDIVHLSDTDTKIAFSTDSIGFSAGNKTHLTLTTSAIEVNKDNLDIDFVIRTTNTSNIFYVDSASDNIGIGTSSPGVTSILDIASTTQGLSVPRMTTAQMNAILGPTAGMVVYATDGGSGNGKLMIRTSAAWETITSS